MTLKILQVLSIQKFYILSSGTGLGSLDTGLKKFVICCTNANIMSNSFYSPGKFRSKCGRTRHSETVLELFCDYWTSEDNSPNLG